MSIVNVWMRQKYALVGVDSIAIGPEGEATEVSKLLPLAHAGAILASTGTYMFANLFFSTLHYSGLDLDGMVDRIPDFLPLVYRETLQRAEQWGVRFLGSPEQQSCLIVGWSKSKGRMIGRYYWQVEASKGFEEREIELGSGYVQPTHADPRWTERLAGLPAPSTPAAMGRYAQEQTRIIREFIPEIHAGGRFIVAELTRDRMTIAPVCDLG